MSANPADRLLHDSSVLLVVGPGGVGKTTLAAALACRAAELHGRRVLLITVDPARRLADVLGVAELPSEPVLVPVANDEGRLWALMVDMAASWDSLVTRLAKKPAERDALLANSLYRDLTTRFIQSHDYIALDRLCDLAEDDRYDLVVVDTPPSTHAIDILDAPKKMVDFFDSRLLRWLTAPYRSRLAYAGARPFLALAERLLGRLFLTRIAEFFWLFSRLQPGFVSRARKVSVRLDDPSTRYVLATTSDPLALDQAEMLVEALAERNRHPGLVIHNRAAPVGPGHDGDLSAVNDPTLRAGMAAIARNGRHLHDWWAEAGSSGGGPDDAGLVTVAWQADPLGSIGELARLFDQDDARDQR